MLKRLYQYPQLLNQIKCKYCSSEVVNNEKVSLLEIPYCSNHVQFQSVCLQDRPKTTQANWSISTRILRHQQQSLFMKLLDSILAMSMAALQDGCNGTCFHATILIKFKNKFSAHTATTTLNGTVAYDQQSSPQKLIGIKATLQFRALHGERDVNSPPITHPSTRRAQYGTFSLMWRAD